MTLAFVDRSSTDCHNDIEFNGKVESEWGQIEAAQFPWMHPARPAASGKEEGRICGPPRAEGNLQLNIRLLARTGPRQEGRLNFLSALGNCILRRLTGRTDEIVSIVPPYTSESFGLATEKREVRASIMQKEAHFVQDGARSGCKN